MFVVDPPGRMLAKLPLPASQTLGRLSPAGEGPTLRGRLLLDAQRFRTWAVRAPVQIPSSQSQKSRRGIGTVQYLGGDGLTRSQ